MKCFMVTLFFFFCAIAAYCQTGTLQKNQTQQKNEVCPDGQQASSSKDRSLPQAEKNQKGPAISVIPTLFLWLMPANSPNPFIKD
jgi:hypothetical protein